MKHIAIFITLCTIVATAAAQTPTREYVEANAIRLSCQFKLVNEDNDEIQASDTKNLYILFTDDDNTTCSLFAYDITDITGKQFDNMYIPNVKVDDGNYSESGYEFIGFEGTESAMDVTAYVSGSIESNGNVDIAIQYDMHPENSDDTTSLYMYFTRTKGRTTLDTDIFAENQSKITVYDINGIRLTDIPASGFYIVNGKKYLAR